MTPGSKWVEKRRDLPVDRRRVVVVESVDRRGVSCTSWYETRTPEGWQRSTPVRRSRCAHDRFAWRYTPWRAEQ